MQEIKRKLLVVVGLTCAGKGYLLRKLIALGLGVTESDMGDIIRHLKRCDPNFANKVNQKQKSGAFCADDLVNHLATDNLEELSKRPIVYLSGYPRTFTQLNHFLELPIVDSHDVSVIHINTPQNICIKRAEADQRGRDDDNGTSVQQKLSDYNSETRYVIDELRKIFPSSEINGQETDKKALDLIIEQGLQAFVDLSQVSDETKEEYDFSKIEEFQENQLSEVQFTI